MRGKGTQLKLGTTSSTTAVADQLEITPPNTQAEIQEYTPLTADAQEFAAGVPNSGEVSYRAKFTATGFATTKSAIDAGTLLYGDLVYTDTPVTTDSFRCLVKSIQVEKIDAKIGTVTGVVTLQISGAVSRATASP